MIITVTVPVRSAVAALAVLLANYLRLWVHAWHHYGGTVAPRVLGERCRRPRQDCLLPPPASCLFAKVRRGTRLMMVAERAGCRNTEGSTT